MSRRKALKGQLRATSKRLEALKSDAVPNEDQLHQIQTLDEE